MIRVYIREYVVGTSMRDTIDYDGAKDLRKTKKHVQRMKGERWPKINSRLGDCRTERNRKGNKNFA